MLVYRHLDEMSPIDLVTRKQEFEEALEFLNGPGLDFALARYTLHKLLDETNDFLDWR